MSGMTTYVGEFHREGEVWEAQARDITGVHTFGKTLPAARDHLREAVAAWLDVPLESVNVTVTVSPINGHTAVRGEARRRAS